MFDLFLWYILVGIVIAPIITGLFFAILSFFIGVFFGPGQ